MNKIYNMKTIKHLKNNYIQLDKTVYKPYTICSLPDKFGAYEEDENGNKYPSISEWFNYKGLTYIAM